MNKKISLPVILLAAYVCFFAILGIKPYDRTVWIAENLPIVLIVAVLAVSYKEFRFTNAAYVLMSFLIFMHTIGGHYTFEKVPFDFITDTFGFERNHYDRLCHFTVGFYAFAVAEFLYRKDYIKSKWVLFLFGVSVILAAAAAYEIIEWIFAVKSAPEAGAAFLGSQGDIWDAQKDMLADGLGAVFAMFLFLPRIVPGIKC